ncbi:MAG: multicopper oxidase domain-containing protein, partial [Halobacteria archaeon]|nr:multicopper oxidase domain-containing protein [Halobacteria archaeon]
NGSQSREYIYRLENITDPGNDPSFPLVGTDLGLVSAPIDLGNSTGGVIGPAERLDVVIDFAGYPAGTEIILRNDDPTLPLVPAIMKFIVTGNQGYIGAISSTLRTVTALPEASADNERFFRLEKLVNKACKDGSGRLVNEWVIQSLDGPNGNITGQFWDDVTEFPVLGTREIWEFENPTSSYHPMHVHLVKFQILDKTDMTTGLAIPLQPWELNTWKDIVHIPPNVRARIIMDFEDYPGRFPNHCHLLDHEDHEMMRQFQATFDPANCNGNDICEFGEDSISCASDCAQVSGAFCGNGLCEAGDGEDCITCAEDCAGRQKGKVSNQWCCGNGGTNPIGCGTDVADNRCIDASAGLACRVTPRLSASCGDSLCEGQEQVPGPDFCQVDCDPGPPPVCTRNAPTFALGNDQSIAVDGSAVYTLSVTNNDTTACPDTTFDLGILSETGNIASFNLPSVLSAASVSIAAGAGDTSVTLTVTGNGTGANGDLLDSSVEVRDDVDHAGQEQTDTVRTTIQAAVCTYSNPTVSISPTAQDITVDGGSVNYTVSIANNDTAACPNTTFNLSVSDTNGVDFDPSTLGQNSVTLAPGANTDVTLTVTGQAGTTNGATNDSSVATAADANHGSVTSNTVTTTINVGGVVVCGDITNKQACNAEPTCEWSNRFKTCNPI